MTSRKGSNSFFNGNLANKKPLYKSKTVHVKKRSMWQYRKYFVRVRK